MFIYSYGTHLYGGHQKVYKCLNIISLQLTFLLDFFNTISIVLSCKTILKSLRFFFLFDKCFISVN